MKSDTAHHRIRSALRAELKRRHGQIGQIEADLVRSEGYLSRFCRGDMDLSLKGCLEVLEALEIQPGSFFAEAFGTVTASEDILRTLEGPGPFDRGITAFDQAALDLEMTEIEESNRRRHRVSVEEFVQEPVEVQLRRLRNGQKYRDERFVGQYLEYLERFRFDEPKAASRLVVGLAAHVIPELPLPAAGRAAWLCQGIEVFGSGLRSLSDSKSAARLLRLGVRLSQRHDLPAHRSALLRRATFVASDSAEYEKGVFLVREAQAIAWELGDQKNLALATITNAILNNLRGRLTPAEQGFKRGLEVLRGLDDTEIRLWRATAFSGLVNVFIKRDDIHEALRWMGRATHAFQDEGGLALGKLLWQQGILERMVGRYEQAVETLSACRRLLERGNRIDYALISIELTSLLLEMGRREEAYEVAKGMAALTGDLRDNKVAQAALVEFMRIVLAGGLGRDQLQSLKETIEAGHS